MSASKRRKVEDEADAALKMPTAFSNRRRLGGGETTSAPSTPDAKQQKPSSSSLNSFSVLQRLNRQGDSPSMSAASALRGTVSSAKASRPATLKRGGDSRGERNSAESSLDGASSKVVQLSSFRPSTQMNDGVLKLRLEDSERFMVLGSFGIKVLNGEMTIAGASLRPDKEIYWVHAPHCHAIPILRTREGTRLELHTDPLAIPLRYLGKISPLFRKLWSDPSYPDLNLESQPTTFQILSSSDQAPERSIIQDLTSPPAWNKELSSLAERFTVEKAFTTLVCGPKSSGKSTFSKMLTNRLVTKRREKGKSVQADSVPGVAVLDLDPGQPEYAVPGSLSLVHVTKPNLGAPFTHPNFDNADFRMVRCHALASVTPASDPDCYRECVFNLYEEYHKSLSHLPLVINTPGWILGTGLELLDDIIQRTSPHEVVYMSEDGPLETVDVLKAATKNKFTTLPSQPSEFTARTAAHLRAMQTLSYFHTRSQSGMRLGWQAWPLSRCPPDQVKYNGPNSGILGILSYDYQPPPELLADAINGMVLAAVEIENPLAFRKLTGKDAQMPVVSRTPEGIPFIKNPDDATLDPQHSRLVGLILVRGVDVTSQRLIITSPDCLRYDIQKIRKKGRNIVLVNGKFDAPNWAYTEELYFEAGDDAAGPKTLEVEDQDTSEDESDMEPEKLGEASDLKAVPWVEILRGAEKRPVGSKVWRVRRDLGRNAGDG